MATSTRRTSPSALLLAAAPEGWLAPAVLRGWRAAVSQLSRMSYSVFLIHYAVSLAVSAAITRHFPDSLGWNAAGMGIALGLSIAVGSGLYRLTEQPRQTLRLWGLWAAVFVASAALAMHWAAGA